VGAHEPAFSTATSGEQGFESPFGHTPAATPLRESCKKALSRRLGLNRIGRQAEVGENPLNHLALRDRRQQPQAAAALGAIEHIFGEGTSFILHLLQ